MFKPSILSAALALTSVSALHAQSPDLPPGPAREKVRTACTECHEERIIVQQRLGKPAWTKEVDKMVKWGALVNPADRDAVIDYLSANFASGQAAYVAEKTVVRSDHKQR